MRELTVYTESGRLDPVHTKPTLRNSSVQNTPCSQLSAKKLAADNAMSLFFSIVLKFKGGAVHAVPKFGRGRTIIEYMAQVASAFFA